MQASIVADIARLYLKKSLLERTIRATRLQERTHDETAVQNIALAPERDEVPINEDELSKLGYRRVEPSRTAFSECRRLLNELRARVEREDWSGDLEEIFTPLYGTHPTGLGKSIIDIFNAVAEAAARPGPHANEAACATLKLLLTCEYDAVLDEKELFLSEKQEEFMMGLGSDWLPGTINWGLLLDQEAKIDRLIESKSRLLLRLQSPRRAAQRHSGRPRDDDREYDAQNVEEVDVREWREEESESPRLQVEGGLRPDDHHPAIDQGGMELGRDRTEFVQSTGLEERSRNVL
jgi:hypothetical protein